MLAKKEALRPWVAGKADVSIYLRLLRLQKPPAVSVIQWALSRVAGLVGDELQRSVFLNMKGVPTLEALLEYRASAEIEKIEVEERAVAEAKVEIHTAEHAKNVADMAATDQGILDAVAALEAKRAQLKSREAELAEADAAIAAGEAEVLNLEMEVARILRELIALDPKIPGNDGEIQTIIGKLSGSWAAGAPKGPRIKYPTGILGDELEPTIEHILAKGNKMSRTGQKNRAEAVLKKAEPLQAVLDNLAAVRAKFAELDEDGSGGLDGEEISRLVVELTGEKRSKSQLKKAMKAMDVDGSGVVEFNEFRGWWEDHNDPNTQKGFFAKLFGGGDGAGPTYLVDAIRGKLPAARDRLKSVLAVARVAAAAAAAAAQVEVGLVVQEQQTLAVRKQRLLPEQDRLAREKAELDAQVSHDLQLQSLWIISTAAVS